MVGYPQVTSDIEAALKKMHTVVAVIGVALLSAGAWWWQNRSDAPSPAAGTPGAGVSAPGGAGAPGARPGGAPGGPPGRLGGPGAVAAVEAASVEAMTLTDDALAVGSLRSRQGVVLRPEVSGRVARLGFTDGQRVRRGQLMLQLDDQLQQAQLQQADAQAHIARTNLQRSRELLAQNFVSQSAVDQNEAALAVAESQVALAQAQLARLRVLAPFDGVVGIRSVDVGEFIRDGAAIVGLEDLSALTVDFRLPERYIGRTRTGQAVEVTLDAVPGRTFSGRIEALDSQVDADGRALLVRSRIDDGAGLLKPGMFARGRVVFAVRENATVVPEEALVPLGQDQLLFKVVDGPDGSKVAQRLVARIGARLPGRVEILEGLAPGDVVVTAGHARLMRGDRVPVRIVSIGQPAGGARPGSSAPAGGAGAPAGPGAAGVRPANGPASAAASVTPAGS
jgi:membrane fusion protein, multidrug efflux system